MKLKLFVCSVLLLVSSAGTVLSQDGPTEEKRIKWSLTVVLLDGANRREHGEIPVKEAVQFIAKNSRFDIDVTYAESAAKHGYTPYVTPGNKKKKIKRQTRHAMMGWNLPNSLVKALPVSSSYLFLYKMKGKTPAQAGSALGIDFGLIKGGKPRTYSTVPVDVWWYVNTPKMGFKSWAAQILTHEIINTMQGKLEARPYKCGQLTATSGLNADKYEAERLSKITDKCYKKIGDNKN